MTIKELVKIKSSLEFALRLVKTNGGYESINTSLWIVNRDLELKLLNPQTGKMSKTDVMGNIIGDEA